MYCERVHVFSLVPIAAFLLLRNLTPGLRASVSGGLGSLGRRSLELYVLQYHIFLREGATKVLDLLPAGAPRPYNAVFAALGFVIAADLAHRCTTALLDGLLRSF